MPKYKVEVDGKTYVLESDSPLSDAEIAKALKLGQPVAQPKPTVGQSMAAGIKGVAGQAPPVRDPLLQTELEKAGVVNVPKMTPEQVKARKDAATRRQTERKQKLSPENIDRLARAALARPGSFNIKRQDDPELYDAVQRRVQLINSSPNFDQDQETLNYAGKTLDAYGRLNPPMPLKDVLENAAVRGFSGGIMGVADPFNLRNNALGGNFGVLPPGTKNTTGELMLRSAPTVGTELLATFATGGIGGATGRARELLHVLFPGLINGAFGVADPAGVNPANAAIGGALGVGLTKGVPLIRRGLQSDVVQRMFGKDLLPEEFGPSINRVEQNVGQGYVPGPPIGGTAEGGIPGVHFPAEAPTVAPVAPKTVTPKPTVETPPVAQPRAKVIKSPPPTELEQTASEYVTTAKASLADEAKRRGMAPVAAPEKETVQQWLNRAGKEGLLDDEQILAFADKISKNPRTIEDYENAALSVALNKNVKNRAALVAAYENAATDLERAAIDAKIAKIDDEFNRLSEASRASGSKLGRAFYAKQLEAKLAQDDTVLGLRRKLVQALDGKAATTEQLTAIDEMAAEIERLKKELESARLAPDREQVAADIMSGKSGGAKPRARVNAAEARAKRMEALEEMKAAIKSGYGAFSNPVEPVAKFTYAAGKFVYHLARETAWTSVDALMEAAQAQIKAMTGRDVTTNDLFKAYREYQTAEGMTQKQLRSEQTKLRAELTRKAKLASGETESEAIQTLKDKLAKVNAALAEGRYQDAIPEKRVTREISMGEIRLRRELDAKRREAKAYINLQKDPTLPERVNSVLSSMALINPGPRAIDLAANTTKLTSEILSGGIDWGVSRIFNKIAKGDGRGLTEISAARVRRILDGFTEAVKKDFQMTKKYGDIDSVAKYGRSGIGGKMAGMTDIPFKEYYQRSMMDDLAMQEARIEIQARGGSYTAADLQKLTAKYVANPTYEMELAAHEYALRQTFNNSNAVSKSLNSIVDSIQNPWAKVGAQQLLRFNKVISNVAWEKAQYTPMGIILPLGQLLVGRAGGKAFTPLEIRLATQMFRRGLVGTGMAYLGKVAYEKGYINPEFKQSGGQVYVETGPLDQFGGLMSPFLYGAYDRAADSLSLTPTQKANLRMKIQMDQLINFPLATDLRTFSQGVLSNPTAAGLQSEAGKYAARIAIPSIVRASARAMDQGNGEVSFSPGAFLFDTGAPRAVEAKGFWQQFMKQVPGLRNQLPTAKRKTVPYGPEKPSRTRK